MKALKRRENEIVKETDGVVGIDWATGYPLTRPEWAGGAYTLVEDYVEPEEMDGDGHVPVIIKSEVPEEPAEETITVNGKEYTKEELLKLLAN